MNGFVIERIYCVFIHEDSSLMLEDSWGWFKKKKLKSLFEVPSAKHLVDTEDNNDE